MRLIRLELIRRDASTPKCEWSRTENATIGFVCELRSLDIREASQLYEKCPMTAAHPHFKRGLFRIPKDGRMQATGGTCPDDMSTVSLVTPRPQSICPAGYEVRWLTTLGQKWVHAGDLCDALGYNESGVDYLLNRMTAIPSQHILPVPPDVFLSQAGVEMLLSGCWGQHAYRVAEAIYVDIYQDLAGLGISPWEDRELRCILEPMDWEEPYPLEPRELLQPHFAPLDESCCVAP